MIVSLFHAKNTRDSMFYGKDSSIYSAKDAIKACANDGYELAAHYNFREDLVSTEDAIMDTLERIYAGTQNINKPWCEPARRSTSVGDIVKIGDSLYIVAGCGFEKLV